MKAPQQPPKGKSGHIKVAEQEARRQERKAISANAKAIRSIMKSRRYAVMRVKKYKSIGSIANLSQHNLRNGAELPRNADPSRQDHNRFFLREGCTSLDEAVQSRLDEAGITPRANAVRMIEMIATFSPESQPKDLSKWANDTLAWARDTFGKRNVIGAEIHMDEKTPHLHLQIVPIVSKRRKMRGKDGYHDAKERLDARTLIGGDDGAKKLSALQTSYADAMRVHGLERGIMKSGAHNPHHKDVRVRRGEIIKERGIINLQDRLDRSESKRLKAESDAMIAEGRYASMTRQHYAKVAELEKERKRFRRELDHKEKLRLEAVKQRDELQAKLIQLNPELAIGAKPELKMKVMPGASCGPGNRAGEGGAKGVAASTGR